MTRGGKSWISWSALPSLMLAGTQPAAAAPEARITGLADVAFGTLSNLSSDLSMSQNVCIYSTGTNGGYMVTASGNGSGGAFTIATGSDTMPYEVQWAASAGQSGGTALTANVAASGFTSSATRERCQGNQPDTASLIVFLRASALGSARAGTYSGALTLVVAPN